MKMKSIPNCRNVSKTQVESSPTSPTLSIGPICRICHEGDSKEELVAPCHCTGTMAVVHRGCLERWLSSSNSDACEICKFKFVIFRQPMPFTEWIMRPSNPEDCRNLAGDVLCFVLLTPLATVSSYLCFTGAKSYSSWNVKWEASGLVCLSLMLIAIYFTWCTITVRYHIQNWRQWRSTHQNVHLIQLRRLSESDQVNLNNQDSDGLINPFLYREHHSGGSCVDSLSDSSHRLMPPVSLAGVIIPGSAVVVEMAGFPLTLTSYSTATGTSSVNFNTSGEEVNSGVNPSISAAACASSPCNYQNQCLQPLLLNDSHEEHETKF